MFLCESCHDGDGCKAFHAMTSRGKCEGCGADASCFDCRSHKKRAEPFAMEAPLELYLGQSVPPLTQLPDVAKYTPAVRKVLQVGDRILTLRAKPVALPDDRSLPPDERVLSRLIADMIATVEHHEAYGLAAPQIGVSLRVIVVRGDITLPPTVLINPKILPTGAHSSSKGREGCLSFGSKTAVVRRKVAVDVEAIGADGNPVEIHATGQLARVIQHELDHLDGILMTQRRS